LITAIIPALNRAWCLPRAVESALFQAEADFLLGRDFEVMVVDDGSRDSTGQYLAPLAEKGLVRVITHERPQGVSAARNAGIRASKGDLLAFLDSDDEWLPGKLKAQRAFMDENPRFGLSQCQERWIRGGRRVNPGDRHKKRAGDIFIESLALCLISPSAVIVRRDLFDRVGLFDERLPACEDYELWLRALLATEAGLLDQELTIRHAGHPDQLSSRPGLDRYRIRALKGILRHKLSPERRAAAENELARRRLVYETGRRKRAGTGEPEF
jgi:glycosyltransferase involved in cell wall biosynthesis